MQGEEQQNGVFWADQHFDFGDAINKEIVNDSALEQIAIQPMAALMMPGSVGPQQGMLDGLDVPLPWVPDLVGTRSKEPGGIIVIGSAYAPFIRGISSRNATLPLAEYSRVACELQRNFLRCVVRPDPSYYGKLSLLLDGIVTPSQITLFDLCRLSFAIRGTRLGRNLDRAAEFTFRTAKSATSDQKRLADDAAKRSRQAFIRYLQCEKQREWTRRRFAGTRATDVIALGFLAEHGVLRFFYDLGIRDIRPHRAPNQKWAPNAAQEDRWVINYAKCPLTAWLAAADWWDIKGTISGQERTWRVLPVLHPGRNAEDSKYEKTKNLLRTMMES